MTNWTRHGRGECGQTAWSEANLSGPSIQHGDEGEAQAVLFQTCGHASGHLNNYGCCLPPLADEHAQSSVKALDLTNENGKGSTRHWLPMPIYDGHSKM